MKAYFTASISGKDVYLKNYEKIVETLKDLGYKVFSDHIIKKSKSDISTQNDKERVNYYKKMIEMISSSDICVAETSTSSLSVGHEITVALDKGKPVIALYDKKVPPNLIRAVASDKIQTLPYDLASLPEVLKKSTKHAKENLDIRFNFFISPEINQYLDWVSKVKRTPRAVYLRELLEKEMDKNKEYPSCSPRSQS